MAHSAGVVRCSGARRIWTLGLDTPVTEELHRYELLVPPGCRLVKPWKVSKDGFATMGPPATAEELRNHRDGLYNVRGRHAFWDGKSYNNIIAQHRRPSAKAGNPGGIQHRPRRQPPIPHPLPAALPEFELLLEQFVLREDGDPDDSRGLLVALRASQATAAAAAREEAEIAAAIQAAAALAANPQPVVGDSNDDIDWDNLANSSDDDNGVGRDGAVKGPGVIYLESTIRLVFSF
ncbi:hypothetical protein ZWY2020_008367 [Hordeum vulgare]|nr:hypothetical protein ZWY2020_008367 [Hordeum vulgare]